MVACRSQWLTRRNLLAGSAAAVILTLPGCATYRRWSYIEAVRRLMERSTREALARLMAPGGLWDDQMARLDLPDVFGRRGSVLQSILTSAVFKKRLQRELNHIAEAGIRRAAPVIADTVRTIGIDNARALIEGGPTATTAFLRQSMRGSLVDTMAPALGEGLRVAGEPLVRQAIAGLTGVDLGDIAHSLAREADNAIWGEIGREEAAIRADPGKTNDPVLIEALKPL